jgi:phage-related protein
VKIVARKAHNWNHIHKALLELGFTQVYTHNDKLYYKKRDLDVMIYKSNNIDRAVIEAIAEHINVSYNYFLEMYRRSYQTYSRR